MQVTCKNGILQNDDFLSVTEDENGLKCKILLDMNFQVDLENIPKILKNNFDVYYTQIGAKIFLIKIDKLNKIIFAYVIEQIMKNDEIRIKNIYTSTYVSIKNLLEPFYKYDYIFEMRNIHNNLIDLIDEVKIIMNADYLKNIIKSDCKYVQQLPVKEEHNHFSAIISNEEIEEKPMQPIKEKIITLKQVFPTEIENIMYYSPTEFCKQNGIAYTTLFRNVINKGMTVQEVYNTFKTKRKEKTSNRSKPIEFNGVIYSSQTELCEKLGISQKTLSRQKIKLNDINKAIEYCVKLNEKPRGEHSGGYPPKKYEYLGTEMTIAELSDLSGLPRNTIYQRIHALNWSVEQAVETTALK